MSWYCSGPSWYRAQASAPLMRRRVHYLRAKTNHPAKATMISAQQAAAYYDPVEIRQGPMPPIDAYLADIVDILARGCRRN